jgi:predicted Zn-dependent protease
MGPTFRAVTAALAIGLLAGWSTAAAETSDAGKIPGSSDTLGRVGEAYSFLWDPEVVGTVRSVAETVARAYHAPADRYHLYILANSEVNAFCTPSGDIFIFSGQLARLRTEDELAAVLAHEMAHREADHFTEIGRMSSLLTLPTIAALILSRGEMAVVTSALAVAQAYQLKFSREMENEADLMAVTALRRTAYDPLAMAGALQVIEEADRLMPVQVYEHLSTHPPIEIRKAGLEAILGRSLKDISRTSLPEMRWARFRSVLAGLTGDPEALRRHEADDGAGSGPRRRHLLGLSLLKAGRAGEALVELRAAAAAIPADGLIQADLGAALWATGDSSGARAALGRAASTAPAWAYVPFLLAEIARDEGRIAEAAGLYRRAMELRPEIPGAFLGYGSLLGPGHDGEATYCLGTAAMLDGRFSEAVPLLREARRLLGEFPYWRDRIDSRLAALR